jgi:hypothetical protein
MRLTESDYQRTVTALKESGYRPEWIDFYHAGSQVYANATFVRSDGTGWLARHNLTSQQYQGVFDQYVKSGAYSLRHVDIYVKNGQLYYACVLLRRSAGAQAAYHGLTASRHQQRLDSLKAGGYKPVNLAVASVGGNRYYNAYYDKRSTGAWLAKSFLTSAQYQALVTERLQAGHELAYLKAYTHNNQVYYSAVFHQNINRAQVLRHGMNSSQLATEHNRWTAQGYSVRMVSGAAVGSQHVFAAVWQK